MKKFLLGVAGAALALAAAAPASAASMLAQYFTVQGGTGDDFGGTCCNPITTDLVLGNLSGNGLPVFNPANSNGLVLNDKNGAGELLWWSAPKATATGSAVVGIPFVDGTFFPPNGTGGNNGNGFQTAIFSGILTVGGDQNVNWTVGGDDDVFMFIDGVSVRQIGGVHGFTSNTFDTFVTGGSHQVKIFFADRERTESNFQVALNTQGVSLEAVPEPATWAMMIGGFGLAGIAMRRRRRPASALA